LHHISWFTASTEKATNSEYGNNTSDLTPDSLLYFKTALHQHLRSIGLPYTLYPTGWFSDVNFVPPFGFDIANKTLEIIGSGNTPISFTTRPDIAHFVAYTLTHVSPHELENTTLGVEGERATLLSLKPVFEDVFGGEFRVVHRDAGEVEQLVKEKGAQVFLEYIRLGGERGEVQIQNPKNTLVPGWTPLSISQALKKYYA
jgi:hypothetical protein